MIPLFRSTIHKPQTSSTLIFPPSLTSAVVFDFDAKYNAGFNLRNDMGVDYVVDYTCPVSGIVVSQSIASKQPIKQSDTCIFDGIDDRLFVSTSITQREVWTVCQTSKAAFSRYESPFIGYASFSPILPVLALFAQNDNTTNIFNDVNYAAKQRINNVLSLSFAPMFQLKSWSAEQDTNNNDSIYIGAFEEDYYGWQGEIRRVLIFNRILTDAEKADLQAYLQAYHNF